jgi:carbonic anhydrase/acetyltransferase-like protein (isoleucine patch superfamily)
MHLPQPVYQHFNPNLTMAHIGSSVTLDHPAFIHDSALIYGKVHIGPGVSVWPHVVMRAEMHEIRIGARTNIQDFVMLHVGNFTPTLVGEDCSITHHATLHGCTIGDRCLIGINATLMDGVRVGANSIVAGHSILTEGSEFPEDSVIAGVPAKLVGTRDNSKANLFNSVFYQLSAANYAKGVDRLSPEDLATLAKLMAPLKGG